MRPTPSNLVEKHRVTTGELASSTESGMRKIYGVIFSLDQSAAKEWCYGKCDKVLIGIMNLDGHPIIPCQAEASECPAFESETNEPIGEVDGDLVYIRKLRGKEST